MHVVIFEGQQWKRFLPLSLSRPVFNLATGMTTLLDKQIRHLRPSRLTLWVRPEFEYYCRERIIPRLDIPVSLNTPLDDEPALIFSGRTLHLQHYERPNEPAVVIDADQVIRSAWVISPGLGPSDVLNRTDKWMKLLDLPQMMPQTRLANSPWDLIDWNEESLVEDYTQILSRKTNRPVGPYHVIQQENIGFGQDVEIKPGVVLDASRGPIILADHAFLGANCVIEGPCYIGPHARISPFTSIRPGTSIGTMSKVGGEVSNSIIMGYSNKVHFGYVGDSYVGKWVNIGAGTTTSNLKNTYGEISILLGERKIPTGRRFLGTLFGDHSKLAINTDVMAGTYLGFSSMIASDGYPPQFVPSYGYCTQKGTTRFEWHKAIEVAQRVFARRNRVWTEEDTKIMDYVARTAPQVEQ